MSIPLSQIYQRAATLAERPEVAEAEQAYRAWCLQWSIDKVRAYDVALILSHPEVRIDRAILLETGAAGSLFGCYVAERTWAGWMLDDYSGWPGGRVAYNEGPNRIEGETWPELWRRARGLGRVWPDTGDMLNIRFSDQGFDTVACLSAVEHVGSLANIEQAMREMGRVLRPGGWLCVSPEMGEETFNAHGTWMLSEADLWRYIVEPSGCELVPPYDLAWEHGTDKGPLHDDGREVTSAMMFLRKPA